MRERGYWGESWFELRHDVSAMVGLVLVLFLVIVALLAPVIAPHDPTVQHREGLTEMGSPRAPGSEFWLGTDPLGRDELSRVIFGQRVSMAVGVGANLMAAILSILIGGVAGMSRGAAQTILMRLVDIVLSFPILLLAIALYSVARPGLLTMVLIIGAGFGAYLSRIVFSQTVSLRERDFVLAAETAGVSRARILIQHIVPHVLPSILVFATLGIATAIQLEAALSFVGIGIQPPDASWGNMISEGQRYLRSSPWLIIWPGLAIVTAMVGFSLLGDGLRDALDPTLEKRTQMLRF